MSRARSVPEFIVANSAPWMNGTASANATNECVGKPGRCVSALSPPEFTARSIIGKTSGPITFAGCRTVRTTERRASRKTWSSGRRSRLGGAHRHARPRSSSSAAPSSERPVFARKTSSRDGWWTCSCSIRTCSASSARTTAARSPSSEASRTAPPFDDGDGSPKRLRIARSCSSSAGIGGDRLERRAADLGLQGGRRSLGDDAAVVDDPDAVGEHVGLLEVLGGEEHGDAVVAREPCDLLPERAAALRVEPGRRLVQEQHARPVDERQREVEPALHAARVALHLAVGRVGQPDALEQLVGARSGDPRAAAPAAPPAAAGARGR